jgi:hypothetical protein
MSVSFAYFPQLHSLDLLRLVVVAQEHLLPVATLDLPKQVTSLDHPMVEVVVTLLPTTAMGDHPLCEVILMIDTQLDRLLVVTHTIDMRDHRLVIIHHLAIMVCLPLEEAMVHLLLAVIPLRLVALDMMTCHRPEVDTTTVHHLLADTTTCHLHHPEADTTNHPLADTRFDSACPLVGEVRDIKTKKERKCF